MPSRRMHWLGAVWCMIVAIMPAVAYSANKTWSGAATTDFWWSGNWIGGAAPVSDLTTDVGVFAGTITANQPQLTASGSTLGLSFTTSTGGWTLGSTSSANVLALGASGIATANTSGTNTISANLALGVTQTWSVNTGGTLRISGGVSMGSSLAAPAANALTIGPSVTGSNGTVVFDPTAGNNVAIYYQGTPSGTATSALTIVKPTVFGAAVNSSSGTNFISHATSGGIVVSGSLTVNSGVWLTNDIGRNSSSASVGTVNLNAGTLAAGGSRFMLTINGTAAGQWTVDGGTLKIAGSSVITNAACFQLGGSVGGTPTAATVANFNLKSGLVDVAKVTGSQNTVGAQGGITATPPSVLMNQSGGVAQFGVTAGYDVFTGVTNANTSNNLYIGAVGGSGTGVKAAYTLTGGRLLVAGGLQGNGPAIGSNGVSNFNFMGGVLTAGTVIATNLGSSGTATATSNQVASSDSIGTLVNYGGILAPGGDLLSFSSDQYGNSSIATSAVAGRTTITGNYVVSNSNAALAVNLAGTTASTTFQEAVNSTRFSNVVVSGGGTNTLGGNLLVNLIPGSGGTTFAPTNANTFKIVSFTGAGATNSGTFSGSNVAGGKAIATDGLTAFTITYDLNSGTNSGVTLGSATNNEWNAGSSGSNWNTVGNWTAMAPNTNAFIARFADGASVPAGANAVDLASNLTIQGIQLSSTSRQYTISSSNGSGLTLDASPRNTTNLMTNATTAATAQIADSSAGAGSHTISVPLVLASDLAFSVSNSASMVTMSGNISGAGRSVTKSGSGMLVLSGSNSYSGSTTVTGGTLSVTSQNALPGWNASGKVTVGTGAGLTITSAFAASDLTTLLSNVTFSGSNRLGLDTTNGNLSYSSAIADKGTGGFGLIKLGSGTLTLSGSNSYTGGTVIGTTSSATSAIVVQGNQSAATGGWTIGAANAGRNTVTFEAGSTVAVAAGREIQVGAKSALGSTAASQILTVSGTVTNDGSFYAGRGGQVNLQGGAVWTQAGSAMLEANGGASVTLTATTGASYSYSGASTFTLNGAPTSNGIATVAIAGGTFSTARGFEQTSNLQNAGYARVLLSSGGVLRLTDNVSVLSSGSSQLVRFELGSGGGTINTNGFDAGLAAAVTGSGGLTKSGAGVLTLSGSNSYSGGTQIANGTVRLGSSAALPTASALTLGTGSTAGVLEFNSNTATLGSITFNGSGSQLGTGTGGKLNLLASGTNNATITVASGSHVLHPDTTLQSNVVIDVTSSGAAFTLHGVVDGAKSLTKLGSGTLTINGANFYSGGSYLNGGYVNALNTGALGSGTVTIDGNTILNLNNTIFSNAVVFGSGSGAIINAGSLVNVSGTYSVTSGTGTSITTNYNVQAAGDISFANNLASTVEIQNGGVGTFTADVLGGGSVTVGAGGRGVFSGSVTGPVTTSGSAGFSGSVFGNVTVGGGTATFAGSTGAASTVNVNAGLSVFTGTIGGSAHATASGATVEIRSRVLSSADINAEAGGAVKLMGSEAFDATTIDNDGSVMVNRTANLTLGALISGSGSLTKSDATTLTLTSNNTYSGLTTISGGTLSVGNGGTSGGLAGNVVNNAALLFNRSDASTYAGTISGSGAVRKLGAGKLILSGSSSYSGGTDVAAGTLAVNGSIVGNVAVAAGAVLGGSGSIAGVLSGAGLVGPGNSPGILTASQFDPSSGLDAAFEFTALAPAYSSASASLNDVLRLTNVSNPFASASFTAGNVIDVYFNVDSIASGQVYEGGFFTGLSAESLLAALDGKATFNYWAKTTGTAERTYGGADYVSLTSLSGITGATFQTASVTRDFGAGSITGSVTQFVIIPEPDTIIFAGIGIAMAGWSLWKRRRRTP